MWEDTTSYSRDGKGARGNKKPTTWTAKSGEILITVSCGHRDYPGKWIMHCYTLGMNSIVLVGVQDKDDAITDAIYLVQKRLAKLYSAVSKISLANKD